MKLGFENKRATIALSVLGVILVVAMYSSFFSGPPTSGTPVAARVAAPVVPDSLPSEGASAPRSPASRGRVDEFLPVLHKKHPDKAPDPTPVDPTLRLDLLAKLNEVPAAGSGRDLFSFGKPAPASLAGSEPVVAIWKPIGPPHLTPPPPKPGPPPPTPPPPITLKYYGICTTRADGFKTAFFMDGEDILIEAEGATFKGRYRLLRIGADSAVVEDMQFKHEQTLQLEKDALPGAGV